LFQRCAICLSGRVLDSRLDVSLHQLCKGG